MKWLRFTQARSDQGISLRPPNQVARIERFAELALTAGPSTSLRFGRDDKFVAKTKLSQRIVAFKINLSSRPKRSVGTCGAASLVSNPFHPPAGRRSRWSTLRSGACAVLSGAAWQEIRARSGRDDKFISQSKILHEIFVFATELSSRPERSVVEGPAVNAICAFESGVIPIRPF
jgi:hypothetical protein